MDFVKDVHEHGDEFGKHYLKNLTPFVGGLVDGRGISDPGRVWFFGSNPSILNFVMQPRQTYHNSIGYFIFRILIRHVFKSKLEITLIILELCSNLNLHVHAI